MATTRSQAGKANASKFDAVKNMNSNNGKFGAWLLCVRSPEALHVRFQNRKDGKWIEGYRFQCVLASNDPKQYMYGVIPYDFKNSNSAQEACDKFVEGSIWKITKPSFDTRAKREYVSCPIKAVLLLKSPTQLEKLDGPGDCEELNKWWPSGEIHVPLSLTKTIEALKQVKLPLAFGSGKTPSKALDICGKRIVLEDLKAVQKKDGSEIEVADLTLADDSGVSFKVAVWESEAYDKIKAIPDGEGVSLIGCSATKDASSGDYKINVWKNVHVIMGGSRAEIMTQMSGLTASNCATVTATYSGTAPAIDMDGVQAVPSSAAALSSIPDMATDFPEEIPFQLNRVAIMAPVTKDEIVTKKGDRLWVPITVSDWTGSAVVHVSHETAPSLYGCATAEEVFQKAEEGTLEAVNHRLNMRGIIRCQDGTIRKIVAHVGKSPHIFRVSSTTMRLTKGIATIQSGAAQVAPLEKIAYDPMQGLCVVASKANGTTEMQSCVRVYILVTGTQDSVLEQLDQASYRIISPAAKCVLTTSREIHVDLIGYCDFKKMPKFCLHKTSAIVAITNFEEKEDGRLEAAVEDIDPVSSADLLHVKGSFDVEWQTALTCTSAQDLDSHMSPEKAEFWEAPPRKVTRLSSDPKTPERN